jgi:hypothetical protein
LLAEAVAVDDRDQVVEAGVRGVRDGLSRRAFGELAVSGEARDAVEDLAWPRPSGHDESAPVVQPTLLRKLTTVPGDERARRR